MRTRVLVALLSLNALAGCSTDEAGPPKGDDGVLAPPAPGEGIQYRMTSTIEPGQEIERCMLLKAPPEGLFVKRDEVRFSQGSHHIVLYKTPYKEIPAKARDGTPVNATEVHDCNDGAQYSWKVTGVVAGSQSFEGDSMLGSLPEGVALKVEPGAVLLMNTHYLNASAERLEADARVNLYTMPPESVEVEAGILTHYNNFIRIPANGAASARMRCKLHQDISLVSVQSHMHKRGVGFVANVTSADGSSMEEIYTSASWEEVPVGRFAPPLQIKAGQAIDYQCDYVNTEPREVIQGLTTKDEMCMLFGPYYPRDPFTEYCADEDGFSSETWVGSGEATCAETLSCFVNAKQFDEDGGSERMGCILNGCPGAAEAISRAVHCRRNRGNGACDEACTSGDGCDECLTAACKAAMDSCIAAACD
jgi:hypothetical protein